MARKRATLTDLLNDLTFKTLHDKFKMLIMSRFEYDGLEELGIESRHIERELFSEGFAMFFQDPEMSYMCLKGSPVGKYNVYGDPLSYRATGFNYNKEYNVDDCVIIENNPLRIPTDDFVMFYVNKLAEAERTMDVNVKSSKTPYIIACDDKTELTFKTIFSKVDGNVPAIYADKGLNLDAIQVLNTKNDFLGNELMDYKKSVENELLTLLGFNNLAVDKKERVNVSEANSNNELTGTFADLMLYSRKQAIDRINKKYGLSLTVKIKEVETDVEDVNVRHDEGDNRTA